ncbi:MAG: hypothetical protein P9C36_02715 [Defluviicoccus sp.]|nr:hypothetical protein [Defluviicoccus sp.]MDG4591520.1 hypothetical protein [Defluviicoccus sp.]
MKKVFHTKYGQYLPRVERWDIRGPGQTFQHLATLYAVDEVEVTEKGRLRVTAHIVSRPLCAETLLHGETHPTVFLTL